MFFALFTAVSCGDSTSTQLIQRPESDLNFLSPESSAPPLAASVGTLWAVRGEDRELRMFYRPRAGSTDSSELLRLRIRDETLVNDALGQPIAPGDSILITVTVLDPSKLLVDLQPAGLVFAPGEPAEFRMRYEEAGHDLNRDGSVDSEDDDVEGRLRLWRQELPGEPWFAIGGVLHSDLEELEAELTGFTRYAIAY
jgi:hypothetical protein